MIKKNIKIYRGDDEAILVSVTGIDLQEVAQVDLHAVGEKGVVFRMSTDDNTISITEDGILLDFKHDLHKNVEVKKANYDLQLTYNDGRIKTILVGTIEFTHDFTRGTK